MVENRLVPIKPADVAKISGLVSPFILAASRKGPLPLDVSAVLRLCSESLHQLWVVKNRTDEIVAAAVTGICTDPDGRRVCEWISAAGDNPASWIGFSEQIEEWARGQGCAAMRSFSRPAMGRVLPKSYRVKGVIFEKGLGQ